MIILIGGESHTGKTKLAQALMEMYHIPYTSIDHLKMGLIRGYPNCAFTAEDEHDHICFHMWDMIKGIIQTCKENQQHIILEGCYLPCDKVSELIDDDVIALYLGFSDQYIDTHIDTIHRFQNTIELRMDQNIDIKDMKKGNQQVAQECRKYHLPYFEMKTDYATDISNAYAYTAKHLTGFTLENTVQEFWKCALSQDREALRTYFDTTAQIYWHCTNEHLDVDEYLSANCDYPGNWDGKIIKTIPIHAGILSIAEVWTNDKNAMFHAISLFHFENKKIVRLDEYWADDAKAPSWRLDKNIGKAIKEFYYD